MFEFLIVYSPVLIPSLIIVVVGLVFALNKLPLLTTEYVDIVNHSFNLIITSSFIWLPLLLIFILWEAWMQYVRAKYLFGLSWVLLEIKLPQEITKSPLAMEVFLMSLYQTGGETTFIDKNIKGQVRAHFSLEIVSIEGSVKFYIYSQNKFRGLIESGLYAQYPNIEIHEMPDYTKSVHFDSKEMDLYVTDYALTGPDPFPIKTYVDYGLEKESVDEENKIDPINTVIEYMGSIGPNQQCWLQIIIRAHKAESPKEGTLFGKTDLWKDSAKKEIENIRKAALPPGDTGTKFPNPTKGEQERISALERSVSKISFDTGIRCIYLGKKDFYNGSNIGSVRGLLRAYTNPHLNGFKPTHWLSKFDYPWQDFNNIRQNAIKAEGLNAFKRRSFFHKPHNEGPVIVLNVEELASVFHLPGKVSTTPTLNRIPSKKSGAPANLPI